MENRTPILDELQSIAPAVAHNPQTPYQVPAGYFEGLAGQMLQLVKAEDMVPPVLQQAVNNPYTVPPGYFEQLAAQILQKVTTPASNELPAVLANAGNTPYAIPTGYFEGLADTILNRVKAEQAGSAQEELELLSPLLNKIGKKSPFSMPAGYFEELPENAISGAKAIEFVNEELENLSPLMSSLKDKQVYHAPAGYFENLAGAVLNKVKEQQPAKVIKMGATRRVMRLAVAAVVAGFIGIAGWLYVGSNDKGATGTPPVAAVETPAVPQDISDAELQNYLEGETSALAGTLAVNTVSSDINATDMKDLLADVPDEDLQKYLDQFSNTKDILTN